MQNNDILQYFTNRECFFISKNDIFECEVVNYDPTTDIITISYKHPNSNMPTTITSDKLNITLFNNFHSAFVQWKKNHNLTKNTKKKEQRKK